MPLARSDRATLVAALATRRLDRTLTTSLPAIDPHDEYSIGPTGLVTLDAPLGGGFPRGQLSELAGAPSSGRMTLLLQFIAAATRRGEIAALVDTHDRLDVASATAAGVDLDRLLWIRGLGTGGSPKQDPPYRARHEMGDRRLETAIDRALKALNLVLQAGGFGVVALDLADASGVELRQIPFTTWPRLQRVIEGSDTACVLVTPEPLARSAGGLTLSLAGRAAWAGVSGRSHRLQGLDLRVRVVSPRKRIDGDVTLRTTATA